MPKTVTKCLFGSSVFCAVSLLAVLPWALHELKQHVTSNITASSAEVASDPVFSTPTKQPLMLQLCFLIDTIDSASCSLTMALPYHGETEINIRSWWLKWQRWSIANRSRCGFGHGKRFTRRDYAWNNTQNCGSARLPFCDLITPCQWLSVFQSFNWTFS